MMQDGKMSKLLVKEKEIVVPGEVLAEGMDNLPGVGTYREGEQILAGRLGLTYIDGRTIKFVLDDYIKAFGAFIASVSIAGAVSR